MNRRFVLAGLIAAPLVSRIPGLMMPVRRVIELPRIGGGQPLLAAPVGFDGLPLDGYARQPVKFTSPANGAVLNAGPLHWEPTRQGFVAGLGIYDMSGKLLVVAHATTPMSVDIGSFFNFPAGQVVISV